MTGYDRLDHWLHETHSQHGLQHRRWASIAPLAVKPCHELHQGSPGTHGFHLLQEHLLAGLARALVEIKAALFHGVEVCRAGLVSAITMGKDLQRFRKPGTKKKPRKKRKPMRIPSHPAAPKALSAPWEGRMGLWAGSSAHRSQAPIMACPRAGQARRAASSASGRYSATCRAAMSSTRVSLIWRRSLPEPCKTCCGSGMAAPCPNSRDT